MNDKMTNDHSADAIDRATDGFSFESSEQKKLPQLSHRGLTLMLAFMCLIPIGTIAVLWQYMPPVYEGKLEASVYAEDIPNAEFYAVEYYDRPPVEGGFLVVKNESDQDWTQLNIQVNGNYQIYDTVPILAHDEKRYSLSRFLNRTGARFSLQYNELSRVRIYARRPTKDRATFYHEFQTHYPDSQSYWGVVVLLVVFAFLFLIAVLVFVKLGAANGVEMQAAANDGK
jgi:hypothetical protein